MNPLHVIILALIVLIVVAVVVIIALNQETRRKQRLMNVIKGGSGTMTERSAGKDDQNRRRAEIAKKLQERRGEDDGSGKKKVSISMKIAQAGLSMSVRQFWIYSLVCMVFVSLLAKITGQGPIVILLIAITGLLGIPRFVLKILAGRRQKKFLEEFADALEAMVRLLKAGMPVSEAILMVSREFTGPVGEEMSRIYDKQKIGVALHEAALEATRRMPLPEMQMFATGLAIQAQTGSSLSEVLTNLANVIRSRFRLKRKIKALSSEAIASASIIGALPNLLALGMYFANREYIMVLFTDPFGKVLLAGAVIWMCIGMAVMKVMINFKI